MTRWQVLCDNMNPDLRPMDKAILYRFIGEHTQTTIRRTQYMQVANRKFGSILSERSRGVGVQRL